MSGTSDFTKTPNLGLYKPIYDMDYAEWGMHLNANADVLDGVLGTGTGGMFVPIAGGVMQGQLQLPSISQYTTDVSTFGPTPFFQLELFPENGDRGRLLSLSRVGSAATDYALASAYYRLDDTGGGYNAPRFMLDMQADIHATPVSGLWAAHVSVTSRSVGGNNGGNGHLALDLQGVRPSDTPIGNTTVAATLGAPNATITVADTTNFATGYFPAQSATPGVAFDLTNNPAIVIATAAVTASGGNVMTLANVTNLQVGMSVSAAGVPPNTIITGIGGNQIDISNSTTAAIASGASISFRFGMLVKVGSTNYICVAASAASGAGTLTMAAQVSVADGTAGNIVRAAQGGAPLWGMVIDMQDQTGLPSSASGVTLGVELDVSGNGADDGGTTHLGNSPVQPYQGGRGFITFVAGKFSGAGADFQMATGLTFALSSAGATIGRLLYSVIPFYTAALDLRDAPQLSGANAIWLAQGQTIAFDGGAGITLSEQTGPSMLYLASASGGGLHILSLAGGWSSGNYGRQLFVDSLPNYCNPCIGINSTDGLHPVAISSGGANTIYFNGMPPLTDGTTPPVPIAGFSATGCGFNGHAITAKPTITGAKAGNAALTSLLAALAAYGLVTDSTT